MVQNKRITTANHIRQVLSHEINELRKDESLETVERARAIAYLSSVSLTAIKDGELSDRIEILEKHFEEVKR